MFLLLQFQKCFRSYPGYIFLESLGFIPREYFMFHTQISAMGHWSIWVLWKHKSRRSSNRSYKSDASHAASYGIWPSWSMSLEFIYSYHLTRGSSDYTCLYVILWSLVDFWCNIWVCRNTHFFRMIYLLSTSFFYGLVLRGVRKTFVLLNSIQPVLRDNVKVLGIVHFTSPIWNKLYYITM